ncbi:trypsin-like peptidase domain-containing protein [Aquabacterium sp.]|uniref:trypsin-like peptidase domain-containing protein n=1 Tax=Aquabacterium sp. TaxID=1872578 RepID=UPI0037834DB7
MVTFLAFDKDRSVTGQTTVGTGFVIGAADDLAVVITAKHVLDGVHTIQTPHARHALSALFVPESQSLPTLDPARLKVIWMGTDSAGPLNVAWASFNRSSDLALCVVEPQPVAPPPFKPSSVLLDMAVPAVGEVVHMVSIDEQSAEELVPPQKRDGAGQVMRINRRVSIRRGVVTSVHPDGYNQYRWPCFMTTIPAPGGASGGYVYVPRDGEPIAACGVVCADLDPYHPGIDQRQPGSSLVGCSWPAIALRMPQYVPAPRDAPTIAVLDAMKLGNLPSAVGGMDRFSIEALPDGDYRLRSRA